MLFKKKKIELGLLGPDPTDIRDYQLATIQPEMVAVPDKFDLRDKMGPIGKQNYGTCTSWGSTALKEYWDKQEYHKDINLSEKFVYHNIKKISGLWTIEGDYGRNGLKALCDYGAPLLEDYPDTKDKNWEEYVNKEPSSEIYKKAEEYKGKTYWRVGMTLDEFLQAQFQNNCPVGFGMAWYQSYYQVKSDGKLPLPSGTKYGGHWIATAGWVNDKFWVKNSHGQEWGNEGYFYIPFDEFSKHEIWDCWVLLDMPKPQIKEGWIAENWVKLGLVKDTILTTTAKLNFREQPSIGSSIIRTLANGEKVIYQGERIKAGNYWWLRIIA